MGVTETDVHSAKWKNFSGGVFRLGVNSYDFVTLFHRRIVKG